MGATIIQTTSSRLLTPTQGYQFSKQLFPFSVKEKLLINDPLLPNLPVIWTFQVFTFSPSPSSECIMKSPLNQGLCQLISDSLAYDYSLSSPHSSSVLNNMFPLKWQEAIALSHKMSTKMNLFSTDAHHQNSQQDSNLKELWAYLIGRLTIVFSLGPLAYLLDENSDSSPTRTKQRLRLGVACWVFFVAYFMHLAVQSHPL